MTKAGFAVTLAQKDLGRTFPRLASPATWLAALCLVVQLGQAANMAFVTDRCAEHGAGSHLDEHRLHPTRETLSLQDRSSLQATDLSASEEGEHCPLCQGQREKALSADSANVSASSWATRTHARIYQPSNFARPLYRLAPKTSPPVA